MPKKTTTQFEDEEYSYIETNRKRNRGVRFNWEMEQAVLHVAKEEHLSGGFSDALRLILIGQSPNLIDRGLLCKDHLIYMHKACAIQSMKKKGAKTKAEATT